MSACEDTEAERANLPVDPRAVVARAWDRAARAAGLTNAEIGRACGKSTSWALRSRSDDRENLSLYPSLLDVMAVGARMSALFLQEMRVELLKKHGAAPDASLEVHALAVLAADGEVTTAVASALGDNQRIDAPEKPRIERALRESAVRREKLEALLREGRT